MDNNSTLVLTDKYLQNYDLFFLSWNEVTFFIEDTNKERFFYNILKKIYPNSRLDKVIALNGKRNVIEHCKNNLNSNLDQKRIYVVDLDFDKLLEIKDPVKGLVYLRKYSIENYLIDELTLIEFVRNFNPNIETDDEIRSLINLDLILSSLISYYSDLTIAIYSNMLFRLGKEFLAIDVNRCFSFNNEGISIRNNDIEVYVFEIKELIGNLRWEAAKINLVSKIREDKEWLDLIPGKYILNFIRNYLKARKIIAQLDSEVFFYQLTKESTATSFSDLKRKIDMFLN